MGKYISLSKEGRKKIMEIFKISKGMVSLALNFKVDSILTRRVQYSDIKHYGGELRMDLPIEETIHDSNGGMVQRFKNGCVLCKLFFPYLQNSAMSNLCSIGSPFDNLR